MADVAENIVYKSRLGTVGYRYVLCEADAVDSADTVTISVMDSISGCAAYRIDTGEAVEASASGNVVTIDEVLLANVPLLILALGS